MTADAMALDAYVYDQHICQNRTLTSLATELGVSKPRAAQRFHRFRRRLEAKKARTPRQP